MKKLIAFTLLHLVIVVASCSYDDECDGGYFRHDQITTYSVKNSLFIDGDNNLYLTIESDSTIVEQISHYNYQKNTGYAVYACSPNYHRSFENKIDSIKVFSVFDFDNTHKAGADISHFFRADPYTFNHQRIDSISFNNFQYFQTEALPTNDSIQLRITGRITKVGDFDQLTEKIYLN